MGVKFIKEFGVSDCVACTLRPALKIGTLTGAFVITSQCSHITKSPRTPARFFKSQILTIISICITFLYILNMLHSIHLIADTKMSSLDVLHQVEVILVTLEGISSHLTAILNYKHELTALNGLCEIVKNRYKYGFQSFLTEDITRILVTIQYTECSFNLIGSSFYYGGQLLDLTGFLGFIKWLVSTLAVINYVVIEEQAKNCCFLHQRLIKECMLSVQYYLNSKIDCNTATKIRKPRRNTAVMLKRLSRLRMQLFFNNKQINRYLNLIMLIIWLLGISVMTVNIYCFVVATKNGYYFIGIQSLGKTIITIISTAMWLVQVDDVIFENEKILSFLFKYPISKLSKDEAEQVEMLIATIRIQKPLLSASDLFTVELGLFSSIAGTVITYVLVALQFSASWAEERHEIEPSGSSET